MSREHTSEEGSAGKRSKDEDGEDRVQLAHGWVKSATDVLTGLLSLWRARCPRPVQTALQKTYRLLHLQHV